jgi:glycosyltransferase involved in cell wall biosynthesis
VQTGIKYAVAHDYDCCVQVDGDGQHPPAQVRALIDAWRADPANLVIGSRFLGDGAFRSTWARRLGILTIRRTLALLYGHAITDPTSGLRLLDRAAMRAFAREYPADFPEPVSLALALRQGLRIREIPVTMRPREGGTTSIGGLRPLGYMARVVGQLAIIRLRRRS